MSPASLAARMIAQTALRDDRERAVEILREALTARGPPAEEAIPWHSSLETGILKGTADGLLMVEDGRPIAIAVWDASSPVGATIEVAFVREPRRGPAGYRALFHAIATGAGPVAFAPGGLSGLSGDEERALMRELGFARFARSEMRLPPETPPPPEREGPMRLRSVRDADLPALVGLHARAYDGHFDRYLFLAESYPDRDAELAVTELVQGRWGEFLPWASPIADGDDGPAGAVLVVRAPYGPLIADVMVDPGLQHRGIGRRLLVETIRRLRERGESVIVLNVTEGNQPAVGLYERLGFVRTLGPSYAWYATGRVPVPSGID